MNKILTFAIIFLSFAVFSQKNFKILAETDEKITIEISDIKEAVFAYKSLNFGSYIDFTQTRKVVRLEKLNPQLPVESKTILLPLKGKPSFTIISQEEEIISDVNVLPSKGNLKRNVNPDNLAYEFGQTYSENKFFPENSIDLKSPFNVRSLRGQVIQFSPFQFNPVTKTLKHIKKIVVEISFNIQQLGENELNITEINTSDVEQFGRNFLNEPLISKYAQIEEEGDLLIISPANYVDSLKSLVQWKKQKGFNTKLITVSESNLTAIELKNTIQAEYQSNPNLRYVLLIGDHQQIPAYSYGMTQDNEELWSDSYYGQLTGNDFYPEVFVGRFSGSSSNIATMVKRTLEYETNPLAGDWMTKAIGLGSSEGAGYGDDQQADWQHLRAIRTQLINYGYSSVSEFYDGSRGQGDASGNPNPSIITPVVNAGIGLFNYTGHGDLNSCITGNFGSTQINQGTNNGMYPFVISVACNNGTFTIGNCISETWLKATENNSPSGAIAACGSSILMSWAPPMQTQDGMTDLITRSDATNIKQTLGGLFYNGQMSMLENYPNEGIEVMQTWVFFGDPSVDFRNKITQDLLVDYDPCLFDSTSQIMHFSSTEDDILVSLTQNDTLIAQGRIQNGNLDLLLVNNEIDLPLNVVCSKPNFKPLMATILLGENCSTAKVTKNVSVYPSPANNKLTLDLGQTLSGLEYRIYDATGKIVLDYSNTQFNSDISEIDIQNLANGVYTVVVNSVQINEKLKFVVLK